MSKNVGWTEGMLPNLHENKRVIEMLYDAFQRTWKRKGYVKDFERDAFIREIYNKKYRSLPCPPSWQTSNVVDLARAIYDNDAWENMPILADALMDAGCNDSDVLEHCRGGGHFRGCWLVDLLLGYNGENVMWPGVMWPGFAPSNARS